MQKFLLLPLFARFAAKVPLVSTRGRPLDETPQSERKDWLTSGIPARSDGIPS